MQWLLIHQNFPAEFKALAPLLMQLGHSVAAIGSKPAKTLPKGLRYFHYSWNNNEPAARPLDPDLERNLHRATKVADLFVA
ncbi:hypothetical protein [Synechococcus sp. UW140]|uniref:hypothetical protein n=1 Tax=Synechococcus sp. UW140 TaxID=368503 RepID=UPI003137FABB